MLNDSSTVGSDFLLRKATAEQACATAERFAVAQECDPTVRKFIIALCFILINCTGCSLYRGVVGEKDLTDERLITVSYYGGRDGFQGRRTASGEIFDEDKFTAAHRTLPFGTFLQLTNPRNRKIIYVRINDRGPFVYDRDLDISLSSAKELGIVRAGVALLKAKVSRMHSQSKT